MKQEEPIFIKNLEDFSSLKGKTSNLVKLEFECCICHNIQTITKRNFTNFICSACKKEQTAINKYGSKEKAIESRIRKASKTKEKKYGSAFGNQKLAKETQSSFTEEYKEQISLKRKKSFNKTMISKYGVDNPMKSEIIKENYKKNFIKKYGTNNPAKVRDFLIKSKRKYRFDNLYFDSSYEVAYYIWLKDQNIDFIYHPKQFFIYYVEEKEHYYFPDFFVNGCFQEIKGNQFFDKNGNMINPYDSTKKTHAVYKAKFQCMKNNNIEIFSNNECKKYINYVKKTYGKTFLESCRTHLGTA